MNAPRPWDWLGPTPSHHSAHGAPKREPPGSTDAENLWKIEEAPGSIISRMPTAVHAPSLQILERHGHQSNLLDAGNSMKTAWFSVRSGRGCGKLLVPVLYPLHMGDAQSHILAGTSDMCCGIETVRSGSYSQDRARRTKDWHQKALDDPILAGVCHRSFSALSKWPQDAPHDTVTILACG